MAAPKSASTAPAPWLLPAVAIALTGAGLWWWQRPTPAPQASAPVAAAPAPEAPATAANDGRPRKTLGIFGGTASSDTPHRARTREDLEDEDDLPVPGQAVDRSRKRHRSRTAKDRATGGVRKQDRHTLFASDETAPYASGSQVTLDDVKGLNGDAGTISFWIMPTWSGIQTQDDAALITIGNGVLRVFKNVTFLRYEVTDDDGHVVGLGASIADWKPAEWHQVVTTWDGRTFWLYVDGALISTAAQTGPISLPNGTQVSIGSAFPANRPVAQAVVANVSIRDRALNPTAVTRRFMSGPPVMQPPG